MNSRAKKILGLAIVVLLMGLLFSGGAWAYFGDGWNGAQGDFAGGVLDLKVGRGQTTEALDMDNVAPGAGGIAYYYQPLLNYASPDNYNDS